MNSYPIWILL